jgi:hypothetical protein
MKVELQACQDFKILDGWFHLFPLIHELITTHMLPLHKKKKKEEERKKNKKRKKKRRRKKKKK